MLGDARSAAQIPLPIFAVLGALMALSAMTINIGLPVIPPMVRALGGTVAAGQAAVTCYLAGFALGQIPIGLAADRWGRRATTLWALAGFLTASIAVASANDIHELLAARFAQGVFGASGAVLARAIARDLAKDGDASELLTVLMSILAIAPVLAPLAGAGLYEVGTWRTPFWAVAVYGAALITSVIVLLPETRTARSGMERSSGVLQRALGTPQFLHGATMVALPHAGYLAFITASSSVLAGDYGIGAIDFAWLFAVAAAALGSGGLTARALAKSLGSAKTSNIGVATIALAACGLLSLTWFALPPLPALWACVVVFIFGHGVAAPIFSAKALETMGDVAGGASALMGTLQIVAGFFGSLIAAQWLRGADGLALIMALPALLACLLHLVYLRRS